MPTLADIYSAADSFKRRLTDVVSNPLTSAQQMLDYANDRARGLRQDIGQSAQQSMQTGEFITPQDKVMAAQLAEAYNPVGMTVWHGSPYKFTKFDPSKIGSGEGAQAYGHGLYVAESPKVAQEYAKIEPAGAVASPRRSLFGEEVEPGSPEYKVAQLVDEMGLSKARKFILDWSKNPNPDQVNYVNKASDIISKVVKKSDAKNLGTGNVYKIDLPDEHIEKMLDWDKPLSEQPEIVKSMTPESMGLKLREPVGSGFMAYISPNGKPIGLQMKGTTPEKFRESWIKRLQEIGDLEGGAGRAVGYLGGTSSDLAPSVSEAMRKAGIPGIKYLDQGSRGAGKGSRNFVVFPGNEHLLNITDINGNPLK